MKIISWNLWNQNPNQLNSLDWLLQYKPDIVCLQEVLEPTLEVLLKSNWYVDYVKDCKDRKKRQLYLVILSNWQANNKEGKALINKQVYSLYAKFLGLGTSREFHYIDLELNNCFYRIFNLHLEVASGPKFRLWQFNTVLRHLSIDKENIICGDFNIFANPLINWLGGWLVNFDPFEYLMNERQVFEKVFRKYGLKNVFSKKITYPKYRLQLDHILVQENLPVKSSLVLDKHTSDHCPILLEI